METLITVLVWWAGLGLIPIVIIAAKLDKERSEWIEIDWTKFKSKKHLAAWVIISGPIIWVLGTIKYAFISIVLILWHPVLFVYNMCEAFASLFIEE